MVDPTSLTTQHSVESPRLAIVLSHPTQYYSPWFRHIAANTKIRLRVFYLWDFGVSARRDPQFQTTFRWDVDLLSGYDHEFIPNVARHPGTNHFDGLRNPKLIARLAAWSPSAVLLFGYKSVSHLSTVAWARWHQIPLLFRGDSHFLGRGLPALHRRVLLMLLYSQFAAILPVGRANTAYFRALGVRSKKLFLAPHAVDASRFTRDDTQSWRTSRQLRASLGIPDSVQVVLFAGKLIPAKQPRELLEVFFANASEGTALVYVGDGSEKTLLQSRVQEHGARNVYFLPFANQSEITARYLMADLFVLPSRGHYETWGLAVNEAMLLGIPALVSDLVGCQQDLVTDGETGWVFETSRPGAMAEKLQVALRTLADPNTAATIRRNVRQRAVQYSYTEATAGLERALSAVKDALQ